MRRSFAIGPLASGLMLVSGFSQYAGASLAVGLFASAAATSVAWGRLAGAAVVLLLWRRALPRRSDGTFDRARSRAAVAFGLALGAMNLAFYMAIDRIPLGTAVSLEYLGPVGLAALFGRGWRTRTGVGLAAVGVFLISWAGIDLGDPRVAAGAAWAVAAGTAWALYIWLGRRVAANGDGLAGLSWGMAAAAMAYAPLGLPGFGPIVAQWRLAAPMLGVVLLSSVLPYALDQVVMRRLPAGTFALLSSLLPATSLVVGLVVLRQVPNWAEVVGLVAVSVAVALATAEAAPGGAPARRG